MQCLPLSRSSLIWLLGVHTCTKVLVGVRGKVIHVPTYPNSVTVPHIRLRRHVPHRDQNQHAFVHTCSIATVGTRTHSIHVVFFLLWSMFNRINQITRQLTRQFPNYTHTPAGPTPVLNRGMMTSAEDRSQRIIHTAGCIIIGDEVLGGKVCSQSRDRSLER